MVRCGMFFGSHGYDHFWMNKLAPVEQEREIRLSLDFLTVIGAPNQRVGHVLPVRRLQ